MDPSNTGGCKTAANDSLSKLQPSSECGTLAAQSRQSLTKNARRHEHLQAHKETDVLFVFILAFSAPAKQLQSCFFSPPPSNPSLISSLQNSSPAQQTNESLFLPACQLNAPTGFTDFQHIFNYVSLGVQIKPEAVHKSIGSEQSLTSA